MYNICIIIMYDIHYIHSMYVRVTTTFSKLVQNTNSALQWQVLFLKLHFKRVQVILYKPSLDHLCCTIANSKFILKMPNHVLSDPYLLVINPMIDPFLLFQTPVLT